MTAFALPTPACRRGLSRSAVSFNNLAALPGARATAAVAD